MQLLSSLYCTDLLLLVVAPRCFNRAAISSESSSSSFGGFISISTAEREGSVVVPRGEGQKSHSAGRSLICQHGTGIDELRRGKSNKSEFLGGWEGVWGETERRGRQRRRL